MGWLSDLFGAPSEPEPSEPTPSWIDDSHYQTFDPETRTSTVYKEGGAFFPDYAEKTFRHHEDGTTETEPPGFLDNLLNGGR